MQLLRLEVDDLTPKDRESDAAMTASYPLVKCSIHPGSAKPGYSVCQHVANGADIAIHFAPSEKELGHVLCGRCRADELSCNSMRLTRVANALELHCSDCVAYHLGNRLPAAEVTEPAAVVQ